MRNKPGPGASAVRPWAVLLVQLHTVFIGCWRLERIITYTNSTKIKGLPSWLPWSVEYLRIQWESGDIAYQSPRPGVEQEIEAMQKSLTRHSVSTATSSPWPKSSLIDSNVGHTR